MSAVLRIGHRGLAAHAPENTLAGVRRAHSFGLSWVEIDIRLSADNVAVLSHDSSLLRRGGVRVRVKNRTAARLAKIPVGRGFTGKYAREGMPSLADAFSLLRDLEMGVVAEIKPDEGGEATVVRAVADVIHCAPQKVIIGSFSAPMLEAARQKMPAVPRAFTCNRAGDFAFASLQKTAAANLHCGAHGARREIRKFAAAGFGVYCFTVNCAETAKKLCAAGARGVFTDTGLPELDAD
ncbi:MAG: glycerophosphodiester phosphodiesterase [Gammaproteobacteria bacterium]